MRCLAFLALLLAAALLSRSPAVAAEPAVDCGAPRELIEDEPQLPDLARHFAAHSPVKIVVIGGASTAGTAPDNSYPHFLEAALRRRHPGTAIDIVNRGVAGQTSEQMEARFPKDVYANQPTLVIWETGTVDAVRGEGVNAFADAITNGVAAIQEHKSEVMLMDMQYNPSTVSVINFQPYLDALHQTATLQNVYMFQRFDIMKHWSEAGVFDFLNVPREKERRWRGSFTNAWEKGWRRRSISPHVEMTENETVLSSPMEARARRAALAALVMLGVAVTGFALFAPGARPAIAGIDRCSAPDDVTSLASPLPHTAKRLAEGKSLTIVALGSSSTYGTGATKPEYTYPSRLAALLQARFPDTDIRVINRGVGGELGVGTAERIAHDVLPEKPDLVIWQVGTNDVLFDLDPDAPMKAVRAGIAQIKRAGADVILMDMQYAPAVLMHARYHEMEHALWATARTTGVPLFRRFALMRDWAEHGNMKMSVMVGPDHLHMTDAGYDCLARQLSASILRDAHTRAGMPSPKG